MSNSNWLFPQTLKEAEAAQREMAEKISEEDMAVPPLCIAGMDVSNNPFDLRQMIFASAVVLSYPSLKIEETVAVAEKQEFPYIPGFLGFREAPALVRAFECISKRVDVIMVDGHGISHPRRLGIASHLGVLLGVPTIGVAKSILIGRPEGNLSEEAGSSVPLLWKEKEIALVVRTKRKCSPLIISVGHRIRLKTAIDLVLSCLRGYRLPEPTRQAHLAANRYRKEAS